MRKWIAVAAMMLAPLTAKAQVEHQFTNFQTVGNGFTGTLLFRNVSDFGTATPITIKGFTIRTSARIATACAPTNVTCLLSQTYDPPSQYVVGGVQQHPAPVGPGPYLSPDRLLEDSCGGNDCLSREFTAATAGVLGCEMPTSSLTGYGYFGRTCAALGYTGWIAQDFEFYVGSPSGLGFTPDVSDLSATFQTRAFTPLATTVPEPSTYALMAVGLAALGLVNRRRSA